MLEHGDNTYVMQFRRRINIQLLKYYLYIGKPDYALNIFNELLQTPSKVVDNRIYLVAIDLVLDKYDAAAKLYHDITKTGIRVTDINNLRGFLTTLKHKNIALPTINRFCKEFNLNY